MFAQGEREDGTLQGRTEPPDFGVIIAPPAIGTHATDDRDAACSAAIDPVLDAVLNAARKVGWSDAETVTAAFAHIVEWVDKLGGSSYAIDTLRETAEAIKRLREH